MLSFATYSLFSWYNFNFMQNNLPTERQKKLSLFSTFFIQFLFINIRDSFNAMCLNVKCVESK